MTGAGGPTVRGVVPCEGTVIGAGGVIPCASGLTDGVGCMIVGFVAPSERLRELISLGGTRN